MVVKNFDESLANLRGAVVQAIPGPDYAEPCRASVQLIFENGSRLRTQFWRITEPGRYSLTSFDHQQKYGLPAPIDAIKEFQDRLQYRFVSDVRLREGTRDLVFDFAGGLRLEVFGLTGYEDWDIQFPDKTGEYSNHV